MKTAAVYLIVALAIWAGVLEITGHSHFVSDWLAIGGAK